MVYPVTAASNTNTAQASVPGPSDFQQGTAYSQQGPTYINYNHHSTELVLSVLQTLTLCMVHWLLQPQHTPVHVHRYRPKQFLN